VKDGSLVIGSDEVDDSALTFLGGSYLWDSYYARATARVVNGNSFSIGGRYRNENNHLSCNYYNNRVVLIQQVNGREFPEIETLVAANVGSGRSMDVGISTKGNEASCFLDGKPVVSETIDEGLKYGGISFKIWESSQKGVKLIVSNLVVEKTK
jgi:hypothetical protein